MTDPVLRRVLGVPFWDAAGAVTNPMTATGDMIVGGAAGAPTRLAAGSAGFLLSIVAGVPAWTDAISANIAFGGVTGLIGTTSPLQVNSTGTGIRHNRFGASATAATIGFVKSRGAAIGDLAAVQADDGLMQLSVNAIAGDNATSVAAAAFSVDVPTGGVAAGSVAGRFNWGTTNLAGVNARRMRLSSEGSLIIGDAALPGTNFTTGLAFGTLTGVTPTTTVDLVHLYGLDISAGNRALAIFQESAPNAAAAVASTHGLPVTINGTQYRILLTTVMA